MRLLDPATFAERYFEPESRPDQRTIRSWVREGEIPGREIGRRVYVDADAFEEMTGDSLADKVLTNGRSAA